MAQRGRKTNPAPSAQVTISLPPDEIAFLDALSVVGGYGGNRTRAAAAIIRDEMMRALKAGELDKLEREMQRVRELAKKAKGTIEEARRGKKKPS